VIMGFLMLGWCVGAQLGALLTWALGITQDNLDNFWVLVLICHLSSLLPLTLIGGLAEDPTDDVAAWLDLSQEKECEATLGERDACAEGEADSRGVPGVVVAAGAIVLALLVALACFVWLGPQEKRAAAAATVPSVPSLFSLSGDVGLVAQGERQRRQVHGYFWATDPDRKGTANASAAARIAQGFARNLSEHPGLIDGLIVVHALRTRVVIDSDDAGLSYMLVEPLHADPANSLRGIPPPALAALWREARRQGIKLYGGLGMLPAKLSYTGPNASAPNYKRVSRPQFPWHDTPHHHSSEWFQVDVYHEDFLWRSLQPTADSVVRSCRELGLSGIAVNDETGGWKPRRSQRDLEAFVWYANALADALHEHGLELFVTMAIPDEMGTSLEEVKLLLHESSVDRWLFMDPYWGDLDYIEKHIHNWSAPYAPHGPSGIGAKYAPILWNHPEHQFGAKATGQPMRSLLRYIGANTSVDNLWLWVFPEAIQQPEFVADVRDWKLASCGFA